MFREVVLSIRMSNRRVQEIPGVVGNAAVFSDFSVLSGLQSEPGRGDLGFVPGMGGFGPGMGEVETRPDMGGNGATGTGPGMGC